MRSAGVVVADDVLFCLIVLAYDGQFLHVKPRLLEFLDGSFCVGVRVVDSYHSVVLSHG
jgi:hypothetical protein